MSHYSTCVVSQGRILLMLGVMAARRLSSLAHRRGLIVVWFGHGANMRLSPDSNATRDYGFQYMSVFSVLPIQFRVVHGCHDDERFVQLWNRMVALIPPQKSLRFQSHLGSLPACLQSLRQYGIPHEILPLDEHGNLDATHFRESLPCNETEIDSGGGEDHSLAELLVKTPTIDLLTENDIFLGKGKRSHRFRGNQLFRNAIAENYDAYNECINRREKLSILHLVYFHLLQSGCRFLQPVQGDGIVEPNEWMEIPEDQALQKIAMRMRNSRRKDGTTGR